MSKTNGAPLTREEFVEAMGKIDRRFNAVDRQLALIIQAPIIQDKQITESMVKEFSQH